MEIPPLLRIQGVHRASSLYHQNDGFFYTCSKRKNNNFYFRCSKVGSGCPATAVLSSGCFINSSHRHPPDFHHIQHQIERQRILNEAASLEYATFGEIFNRTRNLSPNIVAHSLQPAMARVRSQALPREPTNLPDLDNILRDERYKCLSATRDFEDSVYAGSASSDGCFVILLLSTKCKSFMKWAIALYGFTTLFSLEGAPHLYGLHVIYTVWDDTIIFLAWILMDSINEQSFRTGLNLLKSTLLECNVKKVLCKYTSLEADIYKQVFPTVEVTFSLHSVVEDVGNFLQSDIALHPHFKDVAILCCALPMLPSDCLFIGFQVVRAEASNYPGLQAPIERLLQYMEYKFFDPAIHQYCSVCGDYYRTSNIDEAVKYRVLRTIDTHKNSVYSLLRGIASIAEVTGRDIEDIECAKSIPRRRATSLSEKQEIVNLTRALCNPLSNKLIAVRNLLTATSLLINHLLPN